MTRDGLAGRTAVVTGAGTGIGREIARGLLARGVRVAGLGRRAEPLDALGREAAKLVTREGRDTAFEPVRVDLRREEEVRRAAATVRDRLGPVDILVNNAGVAEYAPVTQLTTEQWDRMLETNLRGAFLMTRELLPGMLETGRGHILMNVSVAGIKAFPGCGAYGASKFGLLGLTRVLRAETRGTGVRVTALLPGATTTPIWGPDPPPAERIMSAASVAEAALWALASPADLVPEEILLRPPEGDL
jgi:NAD(P)-dependent dehydrogenase (short-subunit alcohol dehydrogenase family)